jgi:hypothetical protein
MLKISATKTYFGSSAGGSTYLQKQKKYIFESALVFNKAPQFFIDNFTSDKVKTPNYLMALTNKLHLNWTPFCHLHSL